MANRTWRSTRANSSSQATTPPITSPWPPRYLVALCRTRRAPRSAGRCSTGVAKVLSASSGTVPQEWATARRSSSASVGLAGVSTMTSPVSGRIASAIPAGSTQVTSVPSSPVSNRWSLHPYSGRTATTCRSPWAPRASRHALSAAMPLANATALSVPSSRARAVSKRATVGLSRRA
ncbi:hypothetical protein M271_07950 [Streptomyces rapamycinicus NRRL 5491]|nr:hypothetical protein M271_07950 [Streptomyces rapamycinicus NRRL 5491]